MMLPGNILKLICLIAYASLLAAPQSCFSQDIDSSFYDIGSPAVIDYFVDPSAGDDTHNGTSRTTAKRTITALWNAIPSNQTLSTGVRINLLPGTYGINQLPNYWENRRGSATAPVIIRSIDGADSVEFSRDINMANVSYFYLIGVTIKNKISNGYGDAFHCEQCDHILLRGNSLNGAPAGRNAGGDIAHETVKFNQSQYIYIENNNIQGADDNGIDWVAVQYGHIRGNRIHDTAGWCAYVKGGSSYVLIESNIAYDCGEGGITAGQGTGLEFMVAPWFRFEANYIKITNNIIHDIQGAAIGVNGGYGILIAHNTAYRTGARSHLLEVVFGERSCDGDSTSCQSLRSQGAWGPATTGDTAQPIGNQDVVVSNNLFYNPSGYSSGSQHLAIYGPRTPSASGIPSPQKSDTALQIKGNLIWNGNDSMPLGIEDSEQGCQSGNTSCTEAQIRADNTINMIEPDFIDVAGIDFRPRSEGTLSAIIAPAIPNNAALDSSLNPIPEGAPSNQLTREFSGASTSTRPPGAIKNSSSSIEFPASDSDTPDDGSDTNQRPELTIKRATATRSVGRVTFTFQVNATDGDGIQSVSARLNTPSRTLGNITLRKKGSRYQGNKSFRTKLKRVNTTVTATDTRGLSSSKSKTIKVPR